MSSNWRVKELSLIIVLLFKLSFCEIIQIDDGKIEGSLMQTRSGEEFNAFLKVPFAEPPTGDLRFKAPIAKVPWGDTVIDGKTFGPKCMQRSRSAEDFMNEDCLHLNVFTKNLPSITNTQLKPVIAFIHGGAFELGTAVDHGPEYLMERDIVLVTINYRVGIFGFLAVETADIPGNAALKDQALALKWIKKNIAKFGGDPTKVTLGGMSAGAHSVTAHMISKTSDGLFHNLIAMSGAFPWQKKLSSNTLEAANAVAEKLNCTTENVESIVKCLSTAPASDLANNMILPYYDCPVLNWLPVVEKDFGQERFLADEPNKLFASGDFSKVKVMVGVTADEFIMPVPSTLSDPNVMKSLNENFNDFAPKCFVFEENDHKSTSEISEIFRKFYFPYKTIDVRSFEGMNKFFADGVIGYGVHRFVHFITNLTDVYYYKFSYVGQNSGFNYPNKKPYGVSHGDDLRYVFANSFMGGIIEQSDPDEIFVQRVTRMWEHFAKTGNPNNATDEYLSEMVWPKHDTISEYYLDIGNHLVEKNGLFLDRYTVWDNLESSSLKISAGFLTILAVLQIFLMF